MYIKKISAYDNVSKEAEILVSDGKNEILCYAWTFQMKDNYQFILDAFMIKDVERNDMNICFATPKNDSYFAYEISGKLLENGKVAVGQLLIDIDVRCVPNDIKPNEYIKFHCLRVDFIQH